MPNLSCSVTRCKHNNNNLCMLNSIKISGGDTKEGTRCDSYAESDGATNYTGEADVRTHVYCLAKDCDYNNDCDCVADGIDICTCSSGDGCKETECHSFTK